MGTPDDSSVPERAGEARDGDLAPRDAPEHGHLQHELVDLPLAARGLVQVRERDDGAGGCEEEEDEVAHEEVGHRHDPAREDRQLVPSRRSP